MRQANFIEETVHSDPVRPADAGGDPHHPPRRPKMVHLWSASCLLMSMAITGWLGLQVAGGALTWAALGLGVIAVFLMWMGLATLWQLKGPAGVVLSRADAPELFDALDRLRKALKGPRIERVVLDTRFKLSICRERRFGSFGGVMNGLTIGLPVLLALDRRRVLALVAREYACFQGGRNRLTQWLSQVLQGLPRLHFMLRPSSALKKIRRRQIEADRLSRKLLGRHVAAAALIEYTVKADWFMREFWPGHWREAAASLRPLPPYAAMRALAAAPPPEDFAQDSLRRALAPPGDFEGGSSLLSDQLDALRAGRQLPAWSSSQAIHLLSARGMACQDEFDRQWCRDNEAEWKLHRSYLSRVRVRGQWLARRFRRMTADDLIEVAGLMRRLDVDANVRELYERALELTPAHAGALRGLLECVPKTETDLRMACARTLFNLSDSNSNRCCASRAAVATLEKNWCDDERDDGDDVELASWRARRNEAEELERRACQELAAVYCFASIAPGDLNEFEKGEMLSRMARCRPVARAWLVRKGLAAFPSQRCYIVFVELSGVNREKRGDLCRELEQSLELPGLIRVVVAGASPTLAEIRLSAFDPVYVRVQGSSLIRYLKRPRVGQ